MREQPIEKAARRTRGILLRHIAPDAHKLENKTGKKRDKKRNDQQAHQVANLPSNHALCLAHES